jgi:hypothetical protein
MGKLPGAKKIAKTWLIPRISVLSYVPGPRGPKPKAQRLAAEKAAILEQAAGVKGRMPGEEFHTDCNSTNAEDSASKVRLPRS